MLSYPPSLAIEEQSLYLKMIRNCLPPQESGEVTILVRTHVVNAIIERTVWLTDDSLQYIQLTRKHA
jgi:hypothetical protein